VLASRKCCWVDMNYLAEWRFVSTGLFARISYAKWHTVGLG
jgi:hypothetical protein